MSLKDVAAEVARIEAEIAAANDKHKAAQAERRQKIKELRAAQTAAERKAESVRAHIIYRAILKRCDDDEEFAQKWQAWIERYTASPTDQNVRARLALGLPLTNEQTKIETARIEKLRERGSKGGKKTAQAQKGEDAKKNASDQQADQQQPDPPLDDQPTLFNDTQQQQAESEQQQKRSSWF